MYTEEDLKKYPFFEKKLKETDIKWMIDPLTGVLSRGFYLEFVRSLIAEGRAFTFGILDMDNFKFINDNFGHHIGDGVLIEMGRSLIECFKDTGLVGRFGGDEFLFVSFDVLSYADKKAFLGRIYDNGTVLRKNIPLEGCSPFVTATIGCATFPDDAKDYDELFDIMDKVLYRGKAKGRNCYIIYVEEKHKNIEIKKIAKKGIYTSFHSMIRKFEMVKGLDNKLQSVLPIVMDELQVTDLYFVNSEWNMWAVRNKDLKVNVGNLYNLLGDDHYTANFVEDMERDMKDKCPELLKTLRTLNVETVLIIRIGIDLETYGFIICAEPYSHRIWQEEEMALLYFLAKIIAANIVIEKQKEKLEK
ncbi:MAG: GGDEF domain-containing protein [Eubacterium sp.]|nr:GGDEF domain-containing protein [Eubacterium sp.]